MTATAVNPWAIVVEERIRSLIRNGADGDEIKFYLANHAPKSAFTSTAVPAPTLGLARFTNPQVDQKAVDPNKWRELFHTYDETR